MNKTTLKVIQISDIVQWSEKKEIELSPKYQRNSVWNDNAKSYLIDTILRGLPIPPIFVRQKIDINTKSTNREIIDGQQRIRAILEYIVDEKFAIKSSHNREYGGMKYSELDDDTKETLLSFEIISEVVTEKDESLIYDMFARLNSNNYVLNKQEIRNAKYWGDFKVLVYNLASKYREFFLEYSMFSDTEFTRMKDIELLNSMLIATLFGIVSETPKSVDKVYEEYDKGFEDAHIFEEQIGTIMGSISSIYDYYNGQLSCLENKNYFFTLFCVLFNQFFGLKDSDLARTEGALDIDFILSVVGQFLNDYNNKVTLLGSNDSMDVAWSEFTKNHRIRTTSKNERIKRITFLNNYFVR